MGWTPVKKRSNHDWEPTEGEYFRDRRIPDEWCVSGEHEISLSHSSAYEVYEVVPQHIMQIMLKDSIAPFVPIRTGKPFLVSCLVNLGRIRADMIFVPYDCGKCGKLHFRLTSAWSTN